MQVFNLRNICGTYLFLILVGEVTVGFTNGLFTPAGFLILSVLYFLLFITYEVLAERFKLTMGQLVLINFSIYSVFITGLLHGEIGTYVTSPHNSLITTLVRIQCSFFPIFAYIIINRFSTRQPTTLPSVWCLSIAWAIFIGLLSLTGKFGIDRLISTFQTAPHFSIIFSIGAIIAVYFAFRPIAKPKSNKPSPRYFLPISLVLLILGLIPSLASFLVLLIAMPVIGVYFILIKSFSVSRF